MGTFVKVYLERGCTEERGLPTQSLDYILLHVFSQVSILVIVAGASASVGLGSVRAADWAGFEVFVRSRTNLKG